MPVNPPLCRVGDYFISLPVEKLVMKVSAAGGH